MPSRFSARNIGNFAMGVACVLWVVSLFAGHLCSILLRLPREWRIGVGAFALAFLLAILVAIVRRRSVSREGGSS